jgi:hypothetical protein
LREFERKEKRELLQNSLFSLKFSLFPQILSFFSQVLSFFSQILFSFSNFSFSVQTFKPFKISCLEDPQKPTPTQTIFQFTFLIIERDVVEVEKKQFCS